MSSPIPVSLGRDAPPSGRPLWELGLWENKGDLTAFLKPLLELSVVDSSSEDRLRRVCEAIDTDVCPAGCNLVYNLNASFNGDTGLTFLKRILSLGARPDVPNSYGKRPLDIALSGSKVQMSKALAVCTATVLVRDDGDLKQAGTGRISLAELASTSKFWAVKHLCRRRLVSLADFSEDYEGKNVFQWAEHHGQAGLVEELSYFLGKLKAAGCTSGKNQTYQERHASECCHGLEDFHAGLPFQAIPSRTSSVLSLPKTNDNCSSVLHPTTSTMNCRNSEAALSRRVGALEGMCDDIRRSSSDTFERLQERLDTLEAEQRRTNHAVETNHQSLISRISSCELFEGRANDSFNGSARTSDKENKSPMSLMVRGLLDQIELISSACGPSIELVEDLLVIARKHDTKGLLK